MDRSPPIKDEPRPDENLQQSSDLIELRIDATRHFSVWYRCGNGSPVTDALGLQTVCEWTCSCGQTGRRFDHGYHIDFRGLPAPSNRNTHELASRLTQWSNSHKLTVECSCGEKASVGPRRISALSKLLNIHNGQVQISIPLQTDLKSWVVPERSVKVSLIAIVQTSQGGSTSWKEAFIRIPAGGRPWVKFDTTVPAPYFETPDLSIPPSVSLSLNFGLFVLLLMEAGITPNAAYL
jgi:hypothetical protein